MQSTKHYSVLNRGVGEYQSKQEAEPKKRLNFHEERMENYKKNLAEFKKTLQKQTKVMVIDLDKQWKQIYGGSVFNEQKVIDSLEQTKEYGQTYTNDQKGLIAQILTGELRVGASRLEPAYHIELRNNEHSQRISRIATIIKYSVEKILKACVFGITIQNKGETLRVNLVLELYMNGQIEAYYAAMKNYLKQALELLRDISHFYAFSVETYHEGWLDEQFENEQRLTEIVQNITYTASRAKMFEGQLYLIWLQLTDQDVSGNKGTTMSKELKNFNGLLAFIVADELDNRKLETSESKISYYQKYNVSVTWFKLEDVFQLSEVFEMAFDYCPDSSCQLSEREITAELKETDFSYQTLVAKHGNKKAEQIWKKYLDFHTVLRFKQYLEYMQGKQKQYEQQMKQMIKFVSTNQYKKQIKRAIKLRVEKGEFIDPTEPKRLISQLKKLKMNMKGYISTFNTIKTLVEDGCQPLADYFSKLCSEENYEKILYVTAKGDSGKSLLRTAITDFMPGLYGAEDKNLLDSTIGRISDIDKRRFLSCDEGLHSKGSCIVDSFYRIGEQGSQIYQLSSDQRKDMSTFYFITQTDEEIFNISSLAESHFAHCVKSNITNDDLVQQLKRRITFLNLSGKHIYDPSYKQFFILSKQLKKHAEKFIRSIIFLKAHNLYLGSKFDWLLSKEHRLYITKLSYLPFIANSLDKGIDKTFEPSIESISDHSYDDMYDEIKDMTREVDFVKLFQQSQEHDFEEQIDFAGNFEDEEKSQISFSHNELEDPQESSEDWD